jgi:hypothetical protein
LSVGKDAADASARRQRTEAELNAMNNGASIVPEKGTGHRSVAAAIAEYLEETTLTKKDKTLAAYTTALNYFTESCPQSEPWTLTAVICSNSTPSYVMRRSTRLAPVGTSSQTSCLS